MDYAQFIWPGIAYAVGVLIIFFAILSIRRDVQPIVVNVINGVAKQAGSNAGAYALAFGFGLSASLEALSDQATILHWVVVAAMCKVLNPFIVAVLAYATQNNFSKKGATPSGGTTPPFPTPAPPAI